MRTKANTALSSKGKIEPTKEKTYVKHDYKDHYFDPFYDHIQAEESRGEGTRRGPRGGVVEPFPSRLYEMLKHAEREGYDSIVSWSPHGRCFVIHKPQQFVDEIMPRYFRQSKLTSFKRQVNLYGFRRLTRGADSGAYYHEFFLRGRPDLCRKIARTRVKGTGGKPSASPDTEPDFYGYPHCFEVGRTSEPLPHQATSKAQVDNAFSEPPKVDPMPPLVGTNAPQRLESRSDTMAGPPGTDRITTTIGKMCMGRMDSLRVMAHGMLEDSNSCWPSDPLLDAGSHRGLRERIQEICSDPLLESMSEDEEHFLRLSSEDAVATKAPQQIEDPNLLHRPLQPPRAFQNFNNFRPGSGNPKLQEASHHNALWSNEDVQLHKSAAPTQVLPCSSGQQFYEYNQDCSPVPAALGNPRPNELYQDPFRDQIGQLFEGPPLSDAGPSHPGHDMEMKSVMDWFCL